MHSPLALRRHRLGAAIVTVSLVFVGLSAIQVAPAQASCASPSRNFIYGTLTGQDHRDINAQIGLNVVDRSGHTIGLNGCRVAGYTKSIWMNMSVSGQGAVHSSSTTGQWRLNRLPANAVSAWIEVYTRTNTPKPCPSCDGPLDTHRYGFVNRRAVPLNRKYVLTAPLNCGLGGTSGSIQGRLMDGLGRPVKYDRIYAWSELTPDGSKLLQGWGQGVQTKGYYKINNLASGQSYVVWATYKGVRTVRRHIPIRACKTVPLAFRL